MRVSQSPVLKKNSQSVRPREREGAAGAEGEGGAGAERAGSDGATVGAGTTAVSTGGVTGVVVRSIAATPAAVASSSTLSVTASVRRRRRPVGRDGGLASAARGGFGVVDTSLFGREGGVAPRRESGACPGTSAP
ncbi:MAG TPA: hypothetical protein VFW70_02220 [Methylomirabilota bacterium]|nr:hypothetical protein [Methylomirabilota bacterium]